MDDPIDDRSWNSKQTKQKFSIVATGNHPIPLTTTKIAHQKLDYIHNNPVEAGFVDKAEEYLYSSARDYYGARGLIDINLLDPLIM